MGYVGTAHMQLHAKHNCCLAVPNFFWCLLQNLLLWTLFFSFFFCFSSLNWHCLILWIIYYYKPDHAETQHNFHGFRKAEAAPITTAITSPRPAPRDAPTAAAEIEPPFFCGSCIASVKTCFSFASSNDSLSSTSS